MKATKRQADRGLVRAVAQRAQKDIYTKTNAGRERELIQIEMDIDAAHEHIPLNLKKLLGFDAFNFAHDVCGIERHMNRETRKLENCFLPRCAR